MRPFRGGDCSRHALYQPQLPPEMRWVQCSACRHVFTEGYWTTDALALIFAKTHDNQKPGYDMEGQRPISAEIVDRVVASHGSGWQPADGAGWLDVGFGNGSLLFTAAEYGFRPVGLDLRADSVAAMAAIGIEAHQRDIVDLDVPGGGGFAVISMADCLEHMPFPKAGLAAARRLIVDGGALFLSMPNAAAPVWEYLDAKDVNPFWGELEHYHNFTRERLYALLAETGFRPVSYGISKRYRCCMEVVAHAV